MPAEKLKQFLDENGVSKRQCAIALGVSSPTIIDWLRGHKRPRHVHRAAISKWTNGIVPEADWETSEDREARKKAEQVQPFEPEAPDAA